jgi:hypothetical protein
VNPLRIAQEIILMFKRRAQEVWGEPHAQLRGRLISDEQRGLPDLFLEMF